jgi:hypothetical protein
MNKRQLFEIIIAITAGVLLYACASTKMTAMKDPLIPSRFYQSILVIAPFSDLESRKTAEDIFITKLSRFGIRATPSLSILFPGRNYSNEEFAKLILDSGADGVLLVTLTDAYTKQTYLPPSSFSTGTATLQGNVALYSGTTQHYGGYYISKPRVRYEIRLFDVSSGQTAWMATSLTRGNAFARFPKLVDSLAETTVEQMQKDQLIP